MDDGGWYVESGVILEDWVSLKSGRVLKGQLDRIMGRGKHMWIGGMYLRSGIRDLLGGRYGLGRP